MLCFEFRVNRSFLKYSSHPITVPKSLNQRMEREVTPGPIRIVSPLGNVYSGTLYKGCSSWGDYFQVRTIGTPANDNLADLPFGIRLTVTIRDVNGGIEVALEPQ